jgi:hypothetical protein
MVETMDSWWCALIIRPSRRTMRAGRGFMEKP